MDLDAVRTFVIAADLGQFQEAAMELGITQQAVSKRIAGLEHELEVTLFSRTPRGARLSLDGQAFLPHARAFLRTGERAIASVHPGRRALRVDVLHRRITPSVLLREFHRDNPDVELDIVTLTGANIDAATEAVHTGHIDASFRALIGHLPDNFEDIEAEPACDPGFEVLVGPGHPLADLEELRPGDLAGHRIWIPGIAPGTEWAYYYETLAEHFDLVIDGIGPHFGDEALLEEIAESPDLATLVGDRDRYLWPTSYDLRRIPIRNPTPVYPYSLIWHRNNPHPGIEALRSYLHASRKRLPNDVWFPEQTHPMLQSG